MGGTALILWAISVFCVGNRGNAGSSGASAQIGVSSGGGGDGRGWLCSSPAFAFVDLGGLGTGVGRRVVGTGHDKGKSRDRDEKAVKSKVFDLKRNEL